MSGFAALHARIGALAKAQIFFIGGSMKSGTTWLQLLLDAHPSVICKGESHLANHLARLLAGSLVCHNRLLAHKNETIFRGIAGFPLYGGEDLGYLTAASLLLGLGREAGKPEPAAVGEKTPDNVRHLAALHRVFPEAKFIHLVRDGRDCAVSGWFHNRRCSPEWVAGNFPSLAAYAGLFATEWARDLEAAATFAAAHPGACLTLRYEDLVADPGAGLARVLDFLGVAGDAGALAGCCAAAAFERLSGGRARGEEDRASFFRIAVPGDWRGHLDTAAGEEFRRRAGPWLERFDYSP